MALEQQLRVHILFQKQEAESTLGMAGGFWSLKARPSWHTSSNKATANPPQTVPPTGEPSIKYGVWGHSPSNHHSIGYCLGENPVNHGKFISTLGCVFSKENWVEKRNLLVLEGFILPHPPSPDLGVGSCGFHQVTPVFWTGCRRNGFWVQCPCTVKPYSHESL